MSTPPLKIYCINLDRRTDRWQHIQNQIQNTPVQNSVTRFPAIEHACGITGCRESHFAVIRKAQEEGLPWIGIMEDDCAFYPHFVSEFPNVLSLLWKHRDSWDIFNSGPINLKCIKRHESNLMQIGNCVCTQFIIINSNAYDKILNSYKIGISDGGVDVYYSNICIDRIFSYAPLLTYQIVSKSDLQNGYCIGETDEFQKAYRILSFFTSGGH
jgi:hypothetical protein